MKWRVLEVETSQIVTRKYNITRPDPDPMSLSELTKELPNIRHTNMTTHDEANEQIIGVTELEWYDDETLEGEVASSGRPITVNVNLTDAIALLRRQKRLEQHELAVAVGVNQTTVSRWETGRAKPGRVQITRLASVLGEGLLQFIADTGGES